MMYNLYRLQYQPPTEAQHAVYKALNEAAIQYAMKLDALIEDSPDKTHAFQALETTRAMAHKAVAIGNQPRFIEGTHE